MAYMIDWNSVSTTAYTTAIGIETDSDSFNDRGNIQPYWVCSCTYSNSHPDIAYTVHQCSRFTHASCQSHPK